MCTNSDELFELIDPILTSIACRLARNDLFAGEEPYDLTNELWVIVLPGLKTFTTSRGSADHFAVVVAGSALRTLKRRRRTRRHQFTRNVGSLHAVIEFGDESVELHETLAHEPSERSRIAAETIYEAMDGAPDHLWEAFHTLEEGTQRKAAKRAKMDRAHMKQCVEALRHRFDEKTTDVNRAIPTTSNGHRVVNQ